MEEFQSSHFNNEGDEFYEEIEAPKFVDFSVPDLSLPDDKSWFCLRVVVGIDDLRFIKFVLALGCDQKHEEEMDPDAIYKSFVLRVMAARSPNLRLQKALNRQALSTNMKCALSAPAKSSKSRISRLTAITAISQKTAEAKVKVCPLPKLNSIRDAKAKQLAVASKGLTTPRYKKCLANPNSFRSVQNPKKTVVVPTNRVVAKALVFHTPKKIERTKTALGRTPVTEICAGMKKLDIISQRRKHVLGYSCKLIRDKRRDNKKSLSLDPSSRKLSAQKVKTRAEVSFLSRNGKGHEAKSSGCLKRESEGNFEKCQGSLLREGVDYDLSDMEIDGKSRDGSLEVCSVLGSSRNNEGNGHEDCPKSVKKSGNLGSTNATREEFIPSSDRSPVRENPQSVFSDVLSREASSLSNSEEDLEENGPPKFQTLEGERDESKEGSGHEENIGSNSLEWKILEEDLPVNQTSTAVGDESEAMESADKENALASDDDNRGLNFNNDHTERKIPGSHEVCRNLQKVARVLGKTSAATDSQGAKYRKTKPTNPKPFRLRTDERGILKEANLERRLHHTLKETTTVLRFPNVYSHRRHGNEIQQNGKSQGQCKHEKDIHEGDQIGSDKKVLKAQSVSYKLFLPLSRLNSSRCSAVKLTTLFNSQQQMRRAYPKTSKCAAEPTTPQRRIGLTHHKPSLVTVQLEDNKDKEDGKDKAAQKIESSLKMVKSPLLRQQLVRPQRVASVRKATVSIVSPARLSVIKETSSTISRPKEVSTTPKSAAATAPNSAAASRSSSQGRRPATIPKEPNFHSIHLPKSCTKKLA
ncbi:hypothetical protein HHK36_008251 [Tetracentron sinense]|uniref:Uncharacterized protein n=1 Tax=Tetracentron sinense TaxID=13715 RepID=A0A835DJV4_TETSI|nr:hypothetical protein HHK36_008251 [Tetracentron sinense]